MEWEEEEEGKGKEARDQRCKEQEQKGRAKEAKAEKSKQCCTRAVQ